MGFLDRLKANGVFAPNPLEPLFGGLVPFGNGQAPLRQRQPFDIGSGGSFGGSNRLSINQQSEIPSGRGMFAREALPSAKKDGKAIEQTKTPLVRFDDSDAIAREKLRADRREFDIQHDLDRDKFALEGSKANLEQSKFFATDKRENEKLGLERDKRDIDFRKQALDEWQAKNPAGELEVDKSGKIMVINKITGKSIDTGLLSGDIGEEQLVNLRFKNAKDLEDIRQKNRLALEDKQLATQDNNVSPTQVRAAESDAAKELLRGKYAAYSKNIGFDRDGNLQFKRFGDAEKDKIFGAFESDMKAAAKTRMNTSRTNTSPQSPPAVSTGDDMVDMIAPDGGALKVPKSQVEAMKANKARLANEPANAAVADEPPMADGIELIYNKAGKVIGARNTKRAK